MSVSVESVKNVSFGKRQTHRNEKVSHEKSYFFRGTGALVGAAAAGLGILSYNSHRSMLSQRFDHEFPKIKALRGSVAVVATALVGLLFGVIPDFVINKTVKNTTLSVNDLLDKKLNVKQ